MRIPVMRVGMLMLLAYSTVQASEWVSLSKSDKGLEYLADVSSIGITGGIRRAWIKVAYLDRKSYTLERDAFDCGQGTMRTEAYTMYFPSGSSYSQPAESLTEQWKPVPPDTMGSMLMQFVCAWKPK
jgi:hypothetical protein